MRKKSLLTLFVIVTVAACRKEDDDPIDPIDPVPTSTERDLVMADYQENYLGSGFSNSGWTGSTATCDAGNIPVSIRDRVLQKINYFRRMVGLNDNITFDTAQSEKFQETALIMLANSQLSHTPPSSWSCWTQLGCDGAGASNLALGSPGDAIRSLMEDAWTPTVGHRRWFLHSTKTRFAYGATSGSTAIGILGVAGGNTQIPAFIAYPPNGYVPRPLVFSRWSFGIPSANFSSATVTMTGPDGNVPLTVISTAAGYGDNSIVWEPQGIVTGGVPDVSYTVTVSGIGNADQTSYTYTVISAQP